MLGIVIATQAIALVCVPLDEMKFGDFLMVAAFAFVVALFFFATLVFGEKGGPARKWRTL